MAYLRLDDESRALIERVCTERQQQVVKLWAGGSSWRQMADILDLDVTTVRGHFRAAMRKLAREPEMVEKARAA